MDQRAGKDASTPSPTAHKPPHTSKSLISFPSPGGRGVRGEGRDLRHIKRLAHTLKPSAGSALWRRTCVDTYAHRERAGVREFQMNFYPLIHPYVIILPQTPTQGRTRFQPSGPVLFRMSGQNPGARTPAPPRGRDASAPGAEHRCDPPPRTGWAA